MSDSLIGELITGAPTLRNSHDQPATTKTRKVIRHDLSRYTSLIGEL